MRTPICDLLGIEHPIVGFTPSEHVAAAISRSGGLGVLGCVRFNDAAELDKVLDWMDASTDGRPYGVDVVMPATIPAEGAAIDLNQLIPAGHREFVEQTLVRLGRSEEHTSELQSPCNLVCRLLLEKKKKCGCWIGGTKEREKRRGG